MNIDTKAIIYGAIGSALWSFISWASIFIWRDIMVKKERIGYQYIFIYAMALSLNTASNVYLDFGISTLLITTVTTFVIVSLIVIYDNKTKQKKAKADRSYKDNGYLYNTLDINVLKHYADRFIEINKDLEIDNISLYRYFYRYGTSDKDKYCFVYEIKNVGNDKMDRIIELQELTGCIKGMNDITSGRELGLDNSFDTVYKDKAPDDYLEEWNFYVKTTNEKMPLGIEESSKLKIL